MEQYLIALDLDGTLLNDSEKIDIETRETLSYLNSLGHKIILCTGRPFRRTLNYYKELQLDTPMINYHGAYLHSSSTSLKIKKYSTLNTELANNVIELSQNFGVQNIVMEYTGERIVFFKTNDDLKREFFTTDNFSVQDTIPLVESPVNIIIHPYSNNYEGLKEYLKEQLTQDFNIIQWGEPWNLIEIINSNTNKATSLSYICNQLGINRKNVIAFGDAENDIEMLKYAEFGIAMGNAPINVKEVALDVTLDNNSNGIASYLKNFFKISNSTFADQIRQVSPDVAR